MAPEIQTEPQGRALRLNLLAGILAMLLVVLPLRGQQGPIEEVPLERCDRLPVVTVQADGETMRFLLDTGATSALDLQKASKGETQRIPISSWNGTVVTKGRKAVIRELAIGRRRLRNLSLPAFDLAPVGRACGGRIDGFLGVDLLEALHATIDLKRFVLRLGEPETRLEDGEDRPQEREK